MLYDLPAKIMATAFFGFAAACSTGIIMALLGTTSWYSLGLFMGGGVVGSLGVQTFFILNNREARRKSRRREQPTNTSSNSSRY